MHSVFAESLNVSQVKDSGTQIEKSKPYIITLRKLNSLKTLVRSVRCLNSLLRYTLPPDVVQLYPIPTKRWGKSNKIALQSNSQFQCIAELFLIL